MLKNAARQLGQALRPIRPGILALTTSKYTGFLGMALRVSSPSFGEGEPIPVRYTGDGQGVSPPLRWEGLPARTASVVLLSLISGLRTFDLVWVMTKGGPGFTSDVLSSVIYKQYQAGFYGLSTAGNVVLFVVVAAIITPLSWWLNRRSEDL